MLGTRPMSRDQSVERRRKPRTKIGLEVVNSLGLDQAPSTLKEISISGALLEPASIRPEVGDVLTLFLSGGPDEEPESVIAEVVRHTSKGFAVAFCVPCSVVNDIIARFGDAVDASYVTSVR